MENKDEGDKIAPRGADWEVVSLTASAYAAAPNPEVPKYKGDEKGDEVDRDKSETSNALFMSGHFVFPPSQHENLPLEPENAEKLDEQEGEKNVSESVVEERRKLDAKDEDNWNPGGLTKSDDFHGIPVFDEKDFGDSTTLPHLNMAGKEKNIYHSFHSEATMGESYIDDEDRVLAEVLESSDAPLVSDIPNLPKQSQEDYNGGSGLPYAAWWKKHAANLYAHAKETNTFWSIFVAAAVMGLVILGQQWQQERWLVLHRKWQSGINDERIGGMVGPLSRFKEAMVGGNRRGSFIRGSGSRHH